MTKKVLLVEDNEMNAKLMRMVFKHRSETLLEARDAPTGLEAARREQPDLILMDLQLQGPMSGLDAIKALKAGADTKDIPVLVLTAHAFQEVEDSAMAVGASGFLSKPLDMAIFTATLDEYLGGGEQAE